MLIRYCWEILRFVLVRSRLIVHPTKSSSSPIDWAAYYFLMHSILFINYGLSPIYSVSYMYTMKITFPSSFTLYNRQGSVLNRFNPTLRVIVLICSLKQHRDACTRPQIDLFVSIYLRTCSTLWVILPLLLVTLGRFLPLLLRIKMLFQRI